MKANYGIGPGGLPATCNERAGRKRARDHVKLMHASLPKSPPETIPLLMIDAETSVSPKLAEVHGLLLGALPFAVREIGEQVWPRSPLLTSSDGGRPWVYESPAERAKKAAKERGANANHRRSQARSVQEPPKRALASRRSSSRARPQ